MKKPTRTPEEIRDAARAELPALRTLSRRFAELYRELRRTPQYQRRLELVDNEDDARPPAELFKLNRVFWLAATLGGGCSPDLSVLTECVDELDKSTDPERWASDPARSRDEHRRRRAVSKEMAAREAADRKANPWRYERLSLGLPVSMAESMANELRLTAAAGRRAARRRAADPRAAVRELATSLDAAAAIFRTCARAGRGRGRRARSATR